MRRHAVAVAVASAAAALALAAAGYAAAAGGLSDVTFAGCLAGGKLTGVRVTATPTCAANATPVQWAGKAAIGSPSPSPTTTTPSPTPTPTGTSAWAWCSSSGGGFMQFGNLALYGGEWNSSLPQTICGNSGSDWQVTFNAPAGNTAILTYPDVQLNYNSSEPALSSLDPAATSSFAETMNTHPGTSAQAAYDIWVGNGTPSRGEVMIWVDTFNRGTVGGATQIGSGTFCGQDWQLWLNGSSELIWYLPQNEQSGQVCPVQMLQDLQARGRLPVNATLSQFEFGWEIASTGGTSETFQVSAYSVTGLPPAN